ncbi:hypothetical protein HG15A2_18570 [Adhaeretor mobilis]|uniref:Uncharacterized protein n=1 Tax=Adhaeretor mobilis TaxID=1930276 RepID=A0A517MUN2_9BACT|nr:hypothetical protein HG15A2_18570 [Adhaeretor mobilis]
MVSLLPLLELGSEDRLGTTLKLSKLHKISKGNKLRTPPNTKQSTAEAHYG